VTDPDWPHHCGDLWRAHVLAATGRDICDLVGPSPRRPRAWAAMLRRNGVRDMGDLVSRVHGPPIDVRLARRGDVVRCGWALGVCRGEVAEFYGGDAVPMREVEQAWRVDGWAGGG
jgi:hypothetical protein